MNIQRRIVSTALVLHTTFVAALPHVLANKGLLLGARDDDDDDEDDSEKHTLAKGAIIGIVIGVVAFVVLVAGATACLWRLRLKKKQKRKNDDDNEAPEKSKNNEDNNRNVDPDSDMGNIAAAANTLDSSRDMGSHNETPNNMANNNYAMNTSRNINHSDKTTPARHMDNNLDTQSDVFVGGSQYEMNTARTVVSENEGLNNFRNTIISVGSIEDDDDNYQFHTSEKHIYGGPPNGPQPSPSPQHSVP